MDDQNKKEDPQKQDKSVDEFEMGRVNNYTRDIKAPEEKPQAKPVDPTAAPPPEAQNRQPEKQQAEQQPSSQQQPTQPPQTQQHTKEGVRTVGVSPAQQKKKVVRKQVDPVARKKAILGCLGAFGGLLVFLLIISFIFIAQSSPDDVSPIARLFGINQATFINGLITFVHLIFIVIALGTFTFTMIGLFKASMAKKDDKITRRRGLKMSMVAGISLILVLITWAFVYLYMDAKRIPLDPVILQPIITEPEDTLELTAPIEIKFDAGNVPVDRSKFAIVAHEWDFGDGNTGTGQITSNVYEEIGVFDVVLTVRVRDLGTGEIGVLSEYSTVVSIAKQAMTASFTVEPQSGEAPLEVEFDASESIHPTGRIDRYIWDMTGDGLFDDAEGIIVSHTFERAGTYTVTLQVVSTTGETAFTEREVEVFVTEDPVAVISIVGDPDVFVTGTAYTFRGEDSTSPSSRITEYSWDFGDGSPPRTTMTATHVFEAPGTYEVSLKVTDEAEKVGEERKTITVRTPVGTPTARIKTTPEYDETDMKLQGTAPLEVSFDASQSTDPDDNIVDYSWDFGDGSDPGTGVTTTHTYREKGTYPVTLEVVNTDGRKGTATLTVQVEPPGIIADLQADRFEGTVPLTVSFDASGSTYEDGQITSYRWDFGDGSPERLGAATISYRYTDIGIYDATVTVIGADTETAEASIKITVREVPLKACFESVFTEGPAPLTTSFDPGCSTGTIRSYFWDFGDGSNSTTIKPTHTFTRAGTYEVELEITDTAGAVDLFKKTITVTD